MSITKIYNKMKYKFLLNNKFIYRIGIILEQTDEYKKLKIDIKRRITGFKHFFLIIYLLS